MSDDMQPMRPVDERAIPPARPSWGAFKVVMAVFAGLGIAAFVVLLVPFGMITDGCHSGDTEWACTLSVRGQNLLVFSPLLWLGVGLAGTGVGGGVAVHFRRTPTLGIVLGVLCYIAMMSMTKGFVSAA